MPSRSFFMQSKEKYDAVDFSPRAKLPRLDKHVNCIATTWGCFIPYNIFGYFLLYFYTDTAGLSPGMAGSIILFARVFDVFTDLAIGYFIDRWNLKPGKYRFWVLLSILPQFIVFILVFTFVPKAPMNFTIVWAWITYGCYGALCATLGYIPQNCQTINMTNNVDERASAASLKGLYENIAILIAAALYLPMVRLLAGSAGNMARGYFLATIMFSVLAMAPVVLTGRLTRKYELNYDGTYRPHLLLQAKKETLPLVTQLKHLCTNRPAMITTFGAVLMYALQVVRSGMTVYLYEYYFQLPEMTSIGLLFNCGLAMLGALSVPRIIKIFKDSNRAFTFMAIFHAAIYILFYVLVRTSSYEAVTASMRFGPMFFLYSICGLFQGMYYVFPMVVMPSAIDYGVWKTGRNQSGFIYAIYGAMLTLGGAVGSFVNGQLLERTGYTPGVAQSDSTLAALLTVGVLLPAILSIVHGALQAFSGISDKKREQWVKEIDERDAENKKRLEHAKGSEA